ncbi:MAG: hypothetical protein ABJN98_01945 [Roseibium sp.]
MDFGLELQASGTEMYLDCHVLLPEIAKRTFIPYDISIEIGHSLRWKHITATLTLLTLALGT